MRSIQLSVDSLDNNYERETHTFPLIFPFTSKQKPMVEICWNRLEKTILSNGHTIGFWFMYNSQDSVHCL